MFYLVFFHYFDLFLPRGQDDPQGLRSGSFALSFMWRQDVNCLFHRRDEIKVIDDWAFEWGYFDAVAEMIGNGATIEQRGKLLRVLKKQDDGSWKVAWVIAHNDL